MIRASRVGGIYVVYPCVGILLGAFMVSDGYALGPMAVA